MRDPKRFERNLVRLLDGIEADVDAPLTSVFFKTERRPLRRVRRMTPRLDVIGIVSSDLGRTIDFYSRLGLEFPADAASQPHVEVALPGGLRVAFDTVETIRSFDPSGPRRPVATDRARRSCSTARPRSTRCTPEMIAAGYDGHLEPWDAFWGQRYAVVFDPDGNTVDLFAATS